MKREWTNSIGQTIICKGDKMCVFCDHCTDICMIMGALSSCRGEVLKWLEEKGEEQWKG